MRIMYAQCSKYSTGDDDSIYPQTSDLRACLHEGGGPQVGEVTCGGLPHLTCKRDHIKVRDYMDRWVTPPKRVTSPMWGPPPPCKQALSSQSKALYLALIN